MNIPLRPTSPVGCVDGVQFSLSLRGSSSTSICWLKFLLSIGIHLAQLGIHSFRRGGTTDAWKSGVDTELPKVHGHWRSEAIDCYLQAPILMTLRAIIRVLGQHLSWGFSYLWRYRIRWLSP